MTVSIHYTEAQKISCMDKILEMDAAADDFRATRYIQGAYWGVHAEFKSPEGDKIEIEVGGAESLPAAVDEAYRRFRRVLGKVPEFDARRTITHQPSGKPQEVDIPF